MAVEPKHDSRGDDQATNPASEGGKQRFTQDTSGGEPPKKLKKPDVRAGGGRAIRRK